MLTGTPFFNRYVKYAHISSGAIGVLVIALLVFSPYISHLVNWKVGEVAKETVLSPKEFEFESAQDRLKTAELRKRRIALVEKTYSLNPDVSKSVIADIEGVFTDIKEYRSKRQSNPDAVVPDTLKRLSSSTQAAIVELDDEALRSLEHFSLDVSNSLLEKGLKQVDAKQVESQLKIVSKQLQINPEMLSLIHDIVLKSLKPNVIFDKEKTNEKIRLESESVKSFTTMYHQGSVIIASGQRISPTQVEVLDALNMYGLKPNLIKFCTIVFLCALLGVLFERFTYLFNPKVYEQSKFFYLIYSISVSTLVLARVIQALDPFVKLDMTQFLIPIPLLVILVSLLVNPSMALMSGIMTSLLVSVMYGNQFHLMLYLVMSTFTSVFVTFHMHKRMEFIRAGYLIGAMNMVLVVMLGLFKEQSAWMWYGVNTTLALVGGIVSAMAAFALMPYLENVFKVTTEHTLLELSNLNHPLLRRLMTAAPGTYQHSLMVANLAEAAADSIGADALLARVGAYYHDVGKIKRPSFFTENQLSGENPHEHITPRMSKLIIAAHPKEGVELAAKYKVPEVIKDFMMQHHGTSVVKFFYGRAMQTEEVLDIDALKEEFRYPGPKPQFKESGIVMLADSLEATLRSIDKPSLSRVEAILDDIIKDRIEDNQLSECPLSLSEIEMIRQAFLTFLRSTYHSRIDYQKELAQKAS